MTISRKKIPGNPVSVVKTEDALGSYVRWRGEHIVIQNGAKHIAVSSSFPVGDGPYVYCTLGGVPCEAAAK